MREGLKFRRLLAAFWEGLNLGRLLVPFLAGLKFKRILANVLLVMVFSGALAPGLRVAVEVVAQGVRTAVGFTVPGSISTVETIAPSLTLVAEVVAPGLILAVKAAGPSLLMAAEPPKEPILRLETGMHTAMIRKVDVDKANRLLVTASDDKTVRLWELATGRLVRVIRPPVGEGDEGKLSAVAISPDGRQIACGGWTKLGSDSGHTVYIFDAETGRLTGRITGLPNVIFHLAYSPGGRFLAICLGEGGLRVYRAGDLRLVRADKDYGSQSNGATFAPDGRLVTSSIDGYLRLYSSDFRLLAKEKTPGGSRPFQVSFSPDGGRIAVGFVDSTQVNVLSGRVLSHLYSPDTTGIANGNLGSVSWSADGRDLYAGGQYQENEGSSIIRWDDGGRGKRTNLTGASDTIMDIRPLQDGGLVYGAGDPAIGVYDGAGRRRILLAPAIADYRGNREGFLLSSDGARVQFGYEPRGKSPAQFSVAARRLEVDPARDGELAPPVVEASGLRVTDWKSTTTPKLNGQPLTLDQYERSRSLAIAPDGGSFLLGTEWYLRLFDREGREKWQVPVPGSAWAVNIAGNGKVAAAAFSDGTIRWYSMADGKEILAFFPHNDKKRWVLWTPEGFFDASEGGAELIGYHLNQGKDKEARFVGVNKFYDQFYRPDLVLAKFQGKDISEYARAVDVKSLLTTKTLPPVVRLTTTSGIRQKRDTTIEGEICDQGGGIGATTLFLNDMPVVMDTDGRGLKIVAKGGKGGKGGSGAGGRDGSGGGMSCLAFNHTVTLTEGENVIALMAKNKANTIESNRPQATLTFRSGQKERPDLYVLAVAVNKYRDGDLRLKFPIPDAADLVKSIEGGGKRLFGKVIVKTVYDDAATRTGIEAAFREVGSRTKRDDVFILFIAGHGITYERDGNYYFLPVDFRFTGEEAIQKQGVSKDDLMRNLTHIQAMKSLLLLDTCNSGSFAEAVASRNIVEKTAVARLSRAVGRSTLVASSKDQAALEGYEGHGVFTWTILQALAGKAADRDGKVTVNSLATYVEETLPKITYKKWGYEQIPQKSLQGMDFPLLLK